MKRTLLLISLITTYLINAQTPNLIFNGNMELYNFPSFTPNGWSSSSDFGDFNQNTTDFSEGLSSVELTAGFTELSMFTTVDIPLESGKTYIIKYSYKYLGSNFNSDDNIEFSFFSTTSPFVHNTNIQNSSWNTVETQFTPTETKADFEATIKITSNYNVLFDDIQVIEAPTLSNTDVDLSKKITILSLKNKRFEIKTTSDVIITKANVFSVIGKKQQIENNSKDYSKLNLETLSSGIYILQITSNKGITSKKILIN